MAENKKESATSEIPENEPASPVPARPPTGKL